MKILYKIPISKIKHTLLHQHFTKQITNSKFCFTCGSTAGYLVRKFFEIPICGSIMVTFNYTFLQNCGFLANVHYIPINDISEFKFFVENNNQFISTKIFSFLLPIKRVSLSNKIDQMSVFSVSDINNNTSDQSVKRLFI